MFRLMTLDAPVGDIQRLNFRKAYFVLMPVIRKVRNNHSCLLFHRTKTIGYGCSMTFDTLYFGMRRTDPTIVRRYYLVALGACHDGIKTVPCLVAGYDQQQHNDTCA
jgi:hypothetical protein